MSDQRDGQGAAPRAFHLGYRPELDGLRAVAVLAVMAFHAGLSFAAGGFLGVDVFFVLSGFLITSLLLEERQVRGGIALGRFYARRALRLFPALVLVVVACLLWTGLAESSAVFVQTAKDAGITAVYAMNWIAALTDRPLLGLLEHTWSLAIEEQFYLVWPLTLLVLLGGRRTPRAVLVFCTVALVGAPLLRFALLDGPGTYARVYNGLDTRADALLAGCLVATLYTLRLLPGPRALRPWLQVLGGAAAVALLVLFRYSARDLFLYRWGLTLATVSAAVLIAALAAAPGGLLARPLRLRPVVWVGRISYGLYLWHWPVFVIANQGRLGWGLWPTTALRVALTFAFATASFYLWERPFLRLKSRLGGTASASGRPAVAVAA
ncbi:MAG: acyltransferase [Acidimicrobiales bacterium]|nr:acyltransferase [Acidimicrobiales bacterium]